MQAGTKLGPYEILAPIGAGGMGEVFRARDHRLNREVAIKILPAAVANDPVRLRRFETEARSAGQLSHPNILAVYDFGVADGAPYLVTELLEGETLRARLSPPVALPPRKVIEIAQQVARGLAAAHAKGIVHRDLKPENIFLTREGQVKILDFGLAKAAAAISDDAATVTRADLTSAGQVLGTAGYMSPEQVRGLAADARSDLFALGAMLYEMLAGRRAFQRETTAETMTAVLKEEPPALAPASGALDPALQRVVDHCLEKDPAARFQTARDLEFALAALEGGSSTRTAAAAALPAPRRPVGAILAAAITGVVVGFAVYFLTRPATAAQWHFTAVTNYAGVQAEPALSPDGRSVAFTSNQDGRYNIYVALIGGGAPVEITHGDNVKAHPAWSPDGATIAYMRLDQSGYWDIWEVPALGGTPRRVIPAASEPSFARDGNLIYMNSDGTVWEASGGGEAAHQIVGLAPGMGQDMDPQMSPDGSQVAFAAGLIAGGPYRDLAVANLRTGKIHILTTTGLANSPAWAPDSRSLYFASNRGGAVNIWKINSNGSDLVQITSGEGDDADLDVAADGRHIIFDTMHVDRALAELNLGGATAAEQPQILNVDPARWIWAPEYSPDGQRLAYFTALNGVISEGIGVANADGANAVPLVEDGREDIFPEWTADGQSLVFRSEDPPELRLVPVEGGPVRQLCPLPADASDSSFPGHDGRILFQEGAEVEVMNPATGKIQRLGNVPPGAAVAAWSPDERQVAYGNQAGLWITDFHGPARQVFRGWISDVAATGQSLYVEQPKPDLSSTVWKVSWSGSGLAPVTSQIAQLWDANFNDNAIWSYFDVAPGGGQVVYQVEPGLASNIGLLTRAAGRR
ncbi:MAG: protein kinase domain-containing protein [Terriglobales bacterium]